MMAFLRALSGRTLTALWIAHWCLLVALTHAPIRVAAPVVRRGEDKLIHLLLYFFLTILGGWRVAQRRASDGRRWLLAWAGVYLAFGVLDEWTQQFVGRTPSIWDWLADAAGV